MARARSIIEHAGYAITEEVGRHLTSAERERAYQVHGRHQRRMASTRALVTPRPTPATTGEATPTDENGDLPRRGCFTGPVTTEGGHLTRAHAREVHASRRPTPRTNKPRQPREVAVQRLAAQLAHRLPVLMPTKAPQDTRRAGCHIGQLCDTLTRAGIDPAVWTARDLHEALNRRNVDDGRDSLPRDLQRDPLALLCHQLRDVLTRTPEPPSQRRAREAEALAAARAAEVAEALANPPAPAAAVASHAAAARALAHHARLTAEDTHRAHRHEPVTLPASPRAARHRF